MKGYRRRYRVKRRPVKKTYRRSYRARKILRQFTKPDGVNSHKFTLVQDVTAADGNATSFVIGWHSN